MKSKFLIYLTLILSLLSGYSVAAGYQKIVHADGSIEYRQAKQAQVKTKPASTTYYKYHNEQGVPSFSDRQPERVSYELVRFDCYACKASSGVNWETTPLFNGRYEETILFYAKQHSVSPALVKAVIHAESAFNPQAKSPVGAQGLMQLMPATAQELGVVSPFDPEANIEGGVRYLAQLLNSFNQDVRLATAAYNAGPGTVRRYKGVPAYAETQAYVERVAILARRYAQDS